MKRLLRGSLMTALVTVAVLFGMASQASASSWSPYKVSVSVGGVVRGEAWGSIEWQTRDRFNIPDFWIKDSSCDSKSVYAIIDVSGYWFGARRSNNAGCGNSVDYTNVHAQDDGIRYITIWVCRDSTTDSCATKTYWNPYA